MSDEPAEDRYELRTTSAVRRALGEILPEAVAAAAYEFMTGPLLREPYRVGKRLLPPMDDRLAHSDGRGWESLSRVMERPVAVGFVRITTAEHTDLEGARHDDDVTEVRSDSRLRACLGRSASPGARSSPLGADRRLRCAVHRVPVQLVADRGVHVPCADRARRPGSGTAPSGVPGVPLELYVIVLSIVAELLAFTAVGLVSAWARAFPRWIPVLRGRGVPALAGVVPAALGAVVLTLLWTWVVVSFSLGIALRRWPLSAATPC